MSYFFDAFSSADFFGKFIFLGLFILSCGSWVFIIHKTWDLYQMRKNAQHFKILTTMNTSQILTINSHSNNPFSILYKTLKHHALSVLDKNRYASSQDENFLSGLDIEYLESHMQCSITEQTNRIEHYLFILSTTKSLAPFLGLLGTVWGILISFGHLQAGHATSSNAAIIGGLSTALTTTVLGLLIAIPALIAHTYLKNLINKFAIEMMSFSHSLIATIEIQYRKVDIK